MNETLLRTIATETGGQYFPVAQAGQLATAFDQIHKNNEDDGTDTDHDGLTDCQERNGAIGGPHFGKRYTSDPTLADTDGDGLTDAEEIGPKLSLPFGNRTFTRNLVFSDPRLADTDGDGLSDREEKIFRTSGWRKDIVDSDGSPDDDPRGSPARHFVGFMAAGYFHPKLANTGLSCNERPGNPGASEQDVRSGRIAIDLGIKLRRGDLKVADLLKRIPDQAGDPTNPGQPHIDDEPSKASIPFWLRGVC